MGQPSVPLHGCASTSRQWSIGHWRRGAPAVTIETYKDGSIVVAYILGAFLVIVGVLLVSGALPFVHYAARLWPRAHSRGSTDLLGSTSFLIRFIGLMLTLAGVGMILYEIISG
jgi:hypothetical protein